ncbi:Trehalose synthase [Nostocoides australiense Ben110]|uniref:Trehalose synthase n=1 Tax=Nostocoides australiense Ben110 TaxID=1193182 RepID=W6JT19_9MICO|nr:maltose alpha-D-glucosyltransferase [Tetrasphaera australiensis]CCH71581.1 Trehalose synthase [Tetrasphaera australiensis Ben110]
MTDTTLPPDEILDPSDAVPEEVSFEGHSFPARPTRLRPRARLRDILWQRKAKQPGTASGDNPEYVAWLESESMLADARQFARKFAGQGSMWQNPYAAPDPRAAIEKAPVWFTAYPISMITPAGATFLGTLGSTQLWDAFQQIGITAIHTGPVKRAGGVTGWDTTPSVDGHFDRISTQFDDAFGTEDEFRAMCEVATDHGGLVIDDIVPGHTGKGADFRLAEMKIGDYPGIYHMVEIPREDWHLLPKVPKGRDSANLDAETEKSLTDAGYIVGEMQRVIFFEPGVKETNWSATGAVLGPDGEEHRWVYLHYFKEGQPSLNWLDPTFAGMRLVIGDALHSLGDLGSGALRLDANGFLGVEKSATGGPAWSEGHPLSEAANQLIASMVRKVGGFTFQELNLTIDDIHSTSERGADLSYDFVNRPAYHHALAMEDAEFLRLTMRTAREMGVDTVSLVHALQNHDEMTYELVHFATLHAGDTFMFRRKPIRGADLATLIRAELTEKIAGETGTYNALFTTNGIASTLASVISASLGMADLSALTNDDVEAIKRAHLLLAMYNAWQPGVFALSGWDLVGALPVERKQVAALIRDGDTRWIHRGAYDLLDFQPNASESTSKMPKARALYGPLNVQLEDPNSFVSRLREILAVRDRHGLATAQQVDIPAVSNKAMLVLVHRLAEADQVTVLNFSAQTISGSVRSDELQPGSKVIDMVTGAPVGEVDDLHSLYVVLQPHEGRSLLVTPPVEH